MNTTVQIRNFIWSILALACVACEVDGPLVTEQPAPHYQAVLRASQQAATRTSLGEGDGTAGSEQEIRWEVGDRLSVWAKKSGASAYTFEAATFQLATFNEVYSTADFMATIPAMTQGTYTYHAVYPVPESRTGTQVSYTLPATQSGQYDPALDVMAGTVTGNALASREDSEVAIPNHEPELSLSHLFHLVRIRIPEGKNLLGKPLKRLKITFPQEVVGTATFDVTNPQSITWSNLSNTIMVEIPDGQPYLDADGRYLWIHIKPTTLNGTITFCGYDEAGIKSHDISTFIQKSMDAQHVTPIALTIPGPHIPVVYLNLREQANYLGEAWQKIILQGLPFGDGTPGGTVSSVMVDATDADYIVAVYPTLNSDGTPDMTSVQGKTLTVTYESKNALLQNKTLVLPTSLKPTTEYTTPINDIPFVVPYLFEEDFSTVTAKDYAKLDWTDNGNAGIAMDDVGLIGWTGAAWQTTANTSLMVAAYIGSSINGTETDCTNGRVDTTPLPLKNNGVNIAVEYMVSGKTEASSAKNSCYFGVTTTPGAISATTTYKSPAMPDRLIASYVINNNGSATNIPVKQTSTIDGCSAATRLTWCCNPTSVGTGFWSGYVTSKYFRVYIDNIKVSIGDKVVY